MTLVESLKSVLCGPDGKCCIAGSDADRHIVDAAIAALQSDGELPPLPFVKEYLFEVGPYAREDITASMVQGQRDAQAMLRAKLGKQEPDCYRLYGKDTGASIFRIKLPKEIDPSWEIHPLYLAVGARDVLRCIHGLDVTKGCVTCNASSPIIGIREMK